MSSHHSNGRGSRLLRGLTLAGAAALVVLAPAVAPAQVPGGIRGTVTTQDGAVLLPGVQVTLGDTGSTATLAEATSDDRGGFRFPGLRPGLYRLRAFLSGFVPREIGPVTVVLGQEFEVAIDLVLEGVSESVEVAGKATVAATETATTKESLSGSLVDLAPLAGDTFQAMLPVLPGVVRASDGRINIKGGRSNESGLQVGGAVVTDPVTGEWGFNLPPEAVVSVDLQPNPYGAEFGRFASGLATIETRSGSNKWRFAANGLVPVPKVRHNVIRGIGSFGPRLSLSGAPVKERLFLHQSVRYQILKTHVRSQPEPRENILLREFESFTRVDWIPSGRHAVTGSFAAVSPWRMDYVTLNTFNPREVTPSVRQRGYTLALSDRSTLGANAFVEASFAQRDYEAEVWGQGASPMEIGVGGNRGNYFNDQRRLTATSQLSVSLTMARRGSSGEHLIKFGADVLRADFTGRSVSRPVFVRRADGSLSQSIEFSAASAQRLAGTDVAVFGQDRWRASDRLLLELGVRADRDGVLRRWHLAPRVGASVSVLPEGRAVVRGGAGLFVGRTPLNVGVFESYETPRVTRFAADGMTPAEPLLAYVHRTGDALRTPYGLTWNLELDQRLTSSVTVRLNHLRRTGRHEYILDVDRSAAIPALVLDSRGRSRYRETELTVQYSPRAGAELNVTYVRSRSEGDLNGFDGYYGNVRNPVVHQNEYGLTGIDVPNRLIVRGEVPLSRKWSISPLVELRNGFPYSAVDQDQQFVGPRNTAGRYPNLYTLDFGINRLIVFRKRETWIGFRFYHLLNTFTPRDVQNNIHAPDYGAFFNSIPRKLGFNFYIEP